MTQPQSDLELLQDPVAQQLLTSQQLARLAYTWTDGTPRVVPIWFHWDGTAVVLGTPERAPKLRALSKDPRVAVTIDDSTSWPYKALLLRGEASVEMRASVTQEYEAAAHRYFGDEQGEAWVSGLRGVPMARVAIEPTWVRILDFVTRFPSALSA
jgi:nitroimidazol reductase NimA-like FMN-containing flavoprotein (pyridoxamine 5'-phosphate oxidase superfamily)